MHIARYASSYPEKHPFADDREGAVKGKVGVTAAVTAAISVVHILAFTVAIAKKAVGCVGRVVPSA